MAFKLVLFCSVLAYANAGGLLAAAPAAVHYSDASAVSSSYIHQATPVASKVAVAPAVATYAAPAVTKVATYAAPSIQTYAAPAYQTYSAPAYQTYSAPAYQTYAAPAIAKVATPAVTYSAGPAVATYSAPAVHSYAAPAVQTYAKVAAPAVAIHDPHYGTSHQSVYRSLGGNQAVSHYSKAVDSAFSSVRKYDTRITNDAQHIVAAAAPVVSTYAAHAPVVSTYATHAAPAVATYAAHTPLVAHAAPAVTTYAAHAPVVAHAAAPVLAKTAISYSPAAVVSHATFSGLGAQYGW